LEKGGPKLDIFEGEERTNVWENEYCAEIPQTPSNHLKVLYIIFILIGCKVISYKLYETIVLSTY